MAERKKVSLKVGGAILWRSRGRCEYGACNKKAAVWGEGKIEMVGAAQFAHILPVGDAGPRGSFKKDFPNVQLDGEENLLLLCGDHHRMVDHDDVEKHTPALLRAMVNRKHEVVEQTDEDFFATAFLRFDHEQLLADPRIGRLFELMDQAQAGGPRTGRELLRKAASQLREIERNEFSKVPSEFLELLKLELLVKSTTISYRASHWHNALARASSTLPKLSTPKYIAAAILLCTIFVRDEYNVFDDKQRLDLIKTLIDSVTPLVTTADDQSFAAFLLGQKAGLLRWRARLLRSTAQRSAFSESARCAVLSIAKHSSLSARMQLALTKHSEARTLPLDEIERYEQMLAEGIEVICAQEMDSYPPAVKYRARFFRDIFEIRKSLDAFWQCVDHGYLSECRRTAYLLGESASIAYALGLENASILADAMQFTGEAISTGYDHERTFMAWIVCRSNLEPEWFRESVHAKFNPDGPVPDFFKLLYDDASRHFGPDAFQQDVLFGVSEGEFWNMMGRLCRSVLNDPDAALEYYDRAERHDHSPGGSFTTKVGRVRAYIQKQQPENAARYLKLIKKTGRAYQARVIASLHADLEASSRI